jgi:hypothetical protein
MTGKYTWAVPAAIFGALFLLDRGGERPNPDFFTGEDGIVHPIEAGHRQGANTPSRRSAYEALATDRGQRALAEREEVKTEGGPMSGRQVLRLLEASGAVRRPIQLQRRERQQERELERQYVKDTPIKRDGWMRRWSRKHLIGLAEYSDIPLADMASTDWLRELDPYKVFEYHDRALSAAEKRSYGLPGGHTSQGDYLHARHARKKRRESQRRAA